MCSGRGKEGSRENEADEIIYKEAAQPDYVQVAAQLKGYYVLSKLLKSSNSLLACASLAYLSQPSALSLVFSPLKETVQLLYHSR